MTYVIGNKYVKKEGTPHEYTCVGVRFDIFGNPVVVLRNETTLEQVDSVTGDAFIPAVLLPQPQDRYYCGIFCKYTVTVLACNGKHVIFKTELGEVFTLTASASRDL